MEGTIEETRPNSNELIDHRNVWEPLCRIPTGLLQLISQNPDAGAWEFTTYKGTHSKAIKVPNTNAIDFWIESPS